MAKRLFPTEGTKIREAYDRAVSGKPFTIDDLGSTRRDILRDLRNYDLIIYGFKGTYFCNGFLHRGYIKPIGELYPFIEQGLINQMKEILRDI